jgi:membrane protease YdiL (CAAX protease family)
VAVFYLVTRTLFGWWVPAQLLDDPNQIASPMPWITAIAMSLNAGIWEEALFRALPLSLLSLWIGQRPQRRWWMAAGVVVSALIFGFGHSSYPSWPPYSRGVEIFLDACLWGVLFLRFGLLVTVVAHFVYDAVLFGIFAASGDATEYRVTAAIIAVALLAPALVILWRGVRQRGFAPAPEDARFSAWTPHAATEPVWPARPKEAGVFTRRARRLAFAAAVAGLVLSVGRPRGPTLGPEFTAQRGHILHTADSMLRARGGDPSGWTRLTSIDTGTRDAWTRFLQRKKIAPEAQRLASSYAPPTWWVVRYVHTAGSLADRTEEWRVRLLPDGRPLDTRHTIPDSARRGAADAMSVRRLALASLERHGIDTSTFQETEYRETPRPARLDVIVTYTDTAVKLPDGAAARAWVRIAGNEPLGILRGVELPEAFLRADREHHTNRMMIGAAGILLLLGLMIAGGVVVKRRLPVALDDSPLDRRTRLWLIGGLALLTTLSNLNKLPSHLSSYDTAQPWSTFLGTTALTVLQPFVFTLMLLGVVLVLDALRRRIGIPMLPGEPYPSPRTDMLIAGLGLGGIIYSVSDLGRLGSRGGIPPVPTTELDTAIPLLAGIPDIPTTAILGIGMIGVPVLIVAGLTPRWSWRALIAGTITVLVGVIAWAFEPTVDVDAAGLTLLIVIVLLLMLAISVWGRVSAWSWIVAALAYQALRASSDTVYGPEWQTRVAGVLSVVVAGALIVLIARRSSREMVDLSSELSRRSPK